MKKIKYASALATSIISIANADVNTTPLLAGYIDNSATGSLSKVNIKSVAKDGYNTAIFSFIKIDGTSVIFADGTQDSMTEMSKEAKDNNMKTLVSVGGQNNTFNPGNLSEEECNQLATNIVNCIKSNGFDGIDFDLEVQTSPILIKSLVSDIKNIDENIIVTASPQVVSINDTLVPVTTGTNQDYSEAIRSGLFDYLFLQEYNSPDENDPNFIINAFDDISKLIPEESSTKILTGQPTAAQAAGQTTLYYPEGSTNPLKTEDVARLMLPKLKQIYNDNKYGGVMGWSINVDYAPDAYPLPSGETAPPHIPGDFAYFLNQCALIGSCDKLPPERTGSKIIQVSNLGKIGIIPTIGYDGGSIQLDYIAQNTSKTYSSNSNPSISDLENKKNITINWESYKGGPVGSCVQDFDMTENHNVLINGDSQACEVSNPNPSDTIESNETLLNGDYKQSGLDNERRLNYSLILQGDGNLVEYANYEYDNKPRAIVWATNKYSSNEPYLTMQKDCNLVEYDKDRNVVWSSGTSRFGQGCYLNVQSDSNLVIYDKDRNVVWSSGSVPA